MGKAGNGEEALKGGSDGFFAFGFLGAFDAKRLGGELFKGEAAGGAGFQFGCLDAASPEIEAEISLWIEHEYLTAEGVIRSRAQGPLLTAGAQSDGAS